MIKKTTVKVNGREFDIVNKDQHPQPIQIRDRMHNFFSSNLRQVPEERLPTWIINKLK